MIQQAARDFAQTELLPGVIEWDFQNSQQSEKNGWAWVYGMMVDPKYGGSGLDGVSYVLAITEI
jgi:alkylation response protein AidB-like acyl-CoA dehydrogenase